MSTASQTPADTRDRLLNAAGEVFAEMGFRTATVRDICERAGANLAAVNYHFQSKESLYAAVLRHSHSCAVEKFPPQLGLPEGASPEQRLHAFVRAFFLRIFDEGQPAWLGKLMAREMVEPTAALDELVERSIRPQSKLLEVIIMDILQSGESKSVDSRLVRRCVASVVGQCLFYHHARPVVTRLYPQQQYTVPEIELLAAHVTAFSFAALQSLAHEESRKENSK